MITIKKILCLNYLSFVTTAIAKAAVNPLAPFGLSMSERGKKFEFNK